MRSALVKTAFLGRSGRLWRRHRDRICDAVGAIILFVTLVIILHVLHGFGLSGLE